MEQIGKTLKATNQVVGEHKVSADKISIVDNKLVSIEGGNIQDAKGEFLAYFNIFGYQNLKLNITECAIDFDAHPIIQEFIKLIPLK